MAQPRIQPDGNSQPGEGERGTVYQLRFEPPFKHASGYLGWTAGDVDQRIAAHVSGHGAAIVRAAVDAGCHVFLVRIWTHVDRHFERQLKDNRNAPRLDPVTQGRRTLLSIVDDGPEVTEGAQA